MDFHHFDSFSHPLYHEGFCNSGAYYPEQGMNGGGFYQPMWPSFAESAPQCDPPLYFSYPDSAVTLPFMYDNYNAQMPPGFAADPHAQVEAFNASHCPLHQGYYGADAKPVEGMQYSTLPAYSVGVEQNGQQNYAAELQFNAAPPVTQSYINYSPTMEKNSYDYRQATFYFDNTQNTTAVTDPLHFAQSYVHAPTICPEHAPETTYNSIRWVNFDSTAAEAGFKSPTRHATRAPAKKAPARSSKGIKKPRHRVTVQDKNLLFRSYVTKIYDRCFWQGCEHIVFTDRQSIREHMEQVHGLEWIPEVRVDCQWESCNKNLKTESLFRHITNSHMHVVEAPCLYGCGEVFSRIDGRIRHMLTCTKGPRSN